MPTWASTTLQKKADIPIKTGVTKGFQVYNKPVFCQGLHPGWGVGRYPSYVTSEKHPCLNVTIASSLQEHSVAIQNYEFIDCLGPTTTSREESFWKFVENSFSFGGYGFRWTCPSLFQAGEEYIYREFYMFYLCVVIGKIPKKTNRNPHEVFDFEL